jgi:(1->4)-alpha-D-glucan 1-alpha-D-glucosylmutase
MPLTDLDSFTRLCAESGIVDAYYDIRGVHHVASVDSRRALLAALQIPAASDAEVRASLADRHRRAWQTVVAPVMVLRKTDAPPTVRLTLDESRLQAPLRWRIRLEDGTRHAGSWQFDVEQAIAHGELDGRRLWRFTVTLAINPEPGYHRLELQFGDNTVESLLIIAPPTCYLPRVIDGGARCWGVSLQLYALRSARNWGIGDFTDLHTAIEILAPLGADSIGLNPLHALFPQLPQNASPYSPSSRDFINPVYLDIDLIAQADGSDEWHRLVHSEPFQSRLRSLRERQRVDYSGVWALKLEALALLYRQFRRTLDDGESERAQNFRAFQAARGDALYRFALFEALQARFHAEDSALQTWQQWPAEFHDPHSAAVAEWSATHRAQIEFHEYLQWQADQQLSALQHRCIQQGMHIGIYNDLAVGNAGFSAACWAEQSQYALDTGIGAPPDDFSPTGQAWGLPPLIPRQLQATAYDAFIRSLRANMRHAGALRIDHVMGLMRLFWVPEGHAADEGTYVTYPFEELLGILALESQRNRCLVIGEDLGTVPDEVRHALWVNRILSYRILLFEKDWQAGSFKAPADYPALALCASGSHDLPTLRGYWREADLELRETLDLYPSGEVGQQQRELRRRDRHEILAALVREDLLDPETATKYQSADSFDTGLLLALQAFLARAPACLMMLQLEDLLGQTQQVNLPGTIEEYPNWRHKIPLALEDWRGAEQIRRIASTINRERSG